MPSQESQKRRSVIIAIFIEVGEINPETVERFEKASDKELNDMINELECNDWVEEKLAAQ